MGKDALLTNEIMPKLNIAGFPEIYDDFNEDFPDIEQFITAIDLKYLRYQRTNESLAKKLDTIRNNIVNQVVALFDIQKLTVTKLDDIPLLKQFVEIIPREAGILTMNYDCVLDKALWLSNRWSPRGGYYLSSFPANDDENSRKDNILLLKLHGSCNFRTRSTDRDLVAVEITDEMFPNCHAQINPRTSNLDYGAKVLIMSYIKQYPRDIMMLWRKAICSLRQTDKLTVIGCSLRDEDTFLRFALYHFGMKEQVNNFTVEIVDQSNEHCKVIEDKIRPLLANPEQQKIQCFGCLQEYFQSQKTSHATAR